MAGSAVEPGTMTARKQALDCDEIATVVVAGAVIVRGTAVGPDSATPASSPAPFSEFGLVSASEPAGTSAAGIES